MAKNLDELTPRDSKFALPKSPKLVEVTPEMAADWLDTRNPDGNRSLSRLISGRYADAMRRGEWKVTHQGLAFDTDGWVVDGQHRLSGIANSGVVVQIWVFPDMPRDTFDAIDVGRRRMASHLLKVPNAVVLTSAVRYLAVTDNIHDARYPGAAFAELTNVETLDLVRRGGHKLEQAARVAWRVRAGARVTPSPMAAVAYQVLNTDQADELDPFVEGLATGANLDRDDPRLRLRNAFMASATTRAATMRTPSHPYALTVKAWNNYVLRRPLSQLGWRADEDVPRVIGYTPTLKD